MAIGIDLNGKIALVTGGGRGIGKAIALALADAGADVAVAARTAVEIDSVAKVIRARGKRSMSIAADITDPDQVQNMLDVVVKEMGAIHILVNNAGGVNQRFPIVDYPERLWDDVMDLNVKGVFLCTKAAGKYLIAQGYGKVINISSIGGIVAEPNNASYHAAKGAVIQFTKSVALEWIRHGINVNAVAPGIVMTGLLGTLDEKRKEKVAQAIPARRFAQPEEIAHVAVFLASDLSRYMVGECVVVDGGLTIT